MVVVGAMVVTVVPMSKLGGGRIVVGVMIAVGMGMGVMGAVGKVIAGRETETLRPAARL